MHQHEAPDRARSGLKLGVRLAGRFVEAHSWRTQSVLDNQISPQRSELAPLAKMARPPLPWKPSPSVRFLTTIVRWVLGARLTHRQPPPQRPRHRSSSRTRDEDALCRNAGTTELSAEFAFRKFRMPPINYLISLSPSQPTDTRHLIKAAMKYGIFPYRIFTYK